jgi:hypothetical protein
MSFLKLINLPYYQRLRQSRSNCFDNEMTQIYLESIQTIKEIQANNGEFGANRYIIKQR